jgi:hypothetical protein
MGQVAKCDGVAGAYMALRHPAQTVARLHRSRRGCYGATSSPEAVATVAADSQDGSAVESPRPSLSRVATVLSLTLLGGAQQVSTVS